MKALDGPAEGVTLSLRTCPVWLRLVQDEDGKWDALDQAGDEPKELETVHVYRHVEGTWGQVFVRPGGRYEHADYRHVPDAPGYRLRTRAEWVAWAREQASEGSA